MEGYEVVLEIRPWHETDQAKRGEEVSALYMENVLLDGEPVAEHSLENVRVSILTGTGDFMELVIEGASDATADKLLADPARWIAGSTRERISVPMRSLETKILKPRVSVPA